MKAILSGFISAKTKRAKPPSAFAKAVAPEVIVHPAARSGALFRYTDLIQEQESIVRRVLDGGPGALIFAEVAPVITLGRRTPRSDLLWKPSEFDVHGIAWLEVDRGGLATYHGPGQWVVFLNERLEALTGDPRGVKNFVHRLLKSVCQVIAETSQIKAQVREGAEWGIWSQGGDKLASIGFSFQRGVVRHGIAINVCDHLVSRIAMRGFRPCGLDRPYGYLHAEYTPARMAEFQRALSDALLREFY